MSKCQHKELKNLTDSLRPRITRAVNACCNWTSAVAGTIHLYIAGEYVSVTTADGDDNDVIAASIAAAIDVLNWLSEYCVSGNGAWTSVTQLYASYQIWANNNHRQYKQSIADLENHLLQRGMRLETRSGNRGFIGIEVK